MDEVLLPTLLTLSLNKDRNGVARDCRPNFLPLCDVIADRPSEPRPSPPNDTPDTASREVDSRELMQGHREIVIRHGDEAYRLSVTRSGKLILRK